MSAEAPGGLACALFTDAFVRGRLDLALARTRLGGLARYGGGGGGQRSRLVQSWASAAFGLG